jgi:putative membrane protein
MRNKFLGIVCLIYSFVIAFTWISNNLKNFLAINMQNYIKLSLIPLIIMGIYLIISKSKNKFKFSDVILLIPLIMIFIAGDGRLTVSFANNRVSNHNKKKTTVVQKKNDDIKDTLNYSDNRNIDFNNIKYDIVDEAYNELAIFFSFDSKAIKHEGETVRVRGFALENEDYIPDGYFMIGKYIITCCAADSSFVGYTVKNGDFKVKSGAWYEIEGVLEKTNLGDENPLMAIRVVNIKSIDKNSEEQYIYQCFAYDKDGSCSKLLEYDMS